MTPHDLLAAFEVLAEAPEGIARLRELVLQLAVRGKLVPQDPNDEPACVLLERIAAEKAQLVKEGKKTALFDIMSAKGKDHLSSGVIAKALAEHDEMAASLIDDAVWALGIALSSAQNLLDLEAMVIGGGLGDRLGQPFVERVSAAMQPNLFVPDSPPVMLGTELGDLSGAVGAAVVAGA